MIDMSKLTPLPLTLNLKRDDYPFVAGPKGNPELLSETDNVNDLAFFILARQAIDVMMWRGWGVIKWWDQRWAIVREPRYNSLVEIEYFFGDIKQVWRSFDPKLFDCPFAGLVEANEWMKAEMP